jgi:hypothetical protein
MLEFINPGKTAPTWIIRNVRNGICLKGLLILHIDRPFTFFPAFEKLGNLDQMRRC